MEKSVSDVEKRWRGEGGTVTGEGVSGYTVKVEKKREKQKQKKKRENQSTHDGDRKSQGVQP